MNRLLVLSALSLFACDGDVVLDASMLDAGEAMTDGALPDGGRDDAGMNDAGIADAGDDAGTDAGPPTTALLALDPSSAPFGAADVGAVGGPTTFYVENIGTEDSGPLAVAILGARAASFELVSDECTGMILAAARDGMPRGSCRIQVSLAPRALGPLEAELEIAASPGGSVRALLSGNGTGPAHFVLEPTVQDFGDATIADPTARELTLRNVGSRPSAVPTISIEGASAGDFYYDPAASTCRAPLAGGATCTIAVRLVPRAIGDLRAMLIAEGSPGGRALAELTGRGQTPASIGGPGALRTFGYTEVGVSSAPLALVFTNVGGVPTLPLTTLLTGADFTIDTDGCAGTTLAPGASCAVEVVFAPAGTGPRNGSLRVSSSASVYAMIGLRGTGLARPPITAVPFGANLGRVTIDTDSSVQIFRIVNPAATATGAITASITGADAASFRIESNDCTTLGPSSECAIGVRFHPLAVRAHVATLSVDTGATGSLSLGIAGDGAPPAALAFTTSPLDFGTVDVGRFAERTLTLRNIGTSTSTAITVALGSGPFSIVSDACSGATLPAGGMCAITLRFTPAAAGDASVDLTASASTGSTAYARLAGSGNDLFRVGVLFFGAGEGSVAGDIACSDDCEVYVRRGTSIALTAVPDTGSRAAGFGGPCGGASCSFTVTNNPTNVLVTFEPIGPVLTVEVAASGGADGTVYDGPSALCAAGSTCTATARHGEARTLIAIPAPGFGFVGWTGECVGEGVLCSLSMTADRRVRAEFAPANVVFATRALYRPDELGGREGADAACQRDAAAAGLSGTFVAFLSTSTESAIERLSRLPGPPRGFVRSDDRTFSFSLPWLATGNVLHPAGIDENGAAIGDEPIVTGTRGDSAPGETCNDWRAAAFETHYSFVYGDYGTVAWRTYQGSLDCSTQAHLFCVQIDHDVDVVQIGTPGRRAFVSSGSFDAASGLAGADELCASEATTNDLPGSFRALLSTSTASAASRFDLTGAPWVRMDGVAWTERAADLADGRVFVPLELGADGFLVDESIPTVHTGAERPGLAATLASCVDYTTSSASEFGVRGDPFRSSRAFLSPFGMRPFRACDLPGRVYCLEE